MTTKNITARNVIEMLQSRQEVESVAKSGPNATVQGWAPHLTAEEIQRAAQDAVSAIALEDEDASRSAEYETGWSERAASDAAKVSR